LSLKQIDVHYSQYLHGAAQGAGSTGGRVMKQIDVIAAIVVVVGALNWGLVAVARFDLVAALFGMQFGEVSAPSALVYGLVGLAGLYQAVSWKRVQNRWAQPAAIATR
jgi:uncharacterized membrane protein YuzA (DUF378 family)